MLTDQTLTLRAAGEFGNNTGTLAAGTYSFYWYNAIDWNNGGQGTASFALTLTALPNNVPDAGSTTMLLGMALSVIGVLRNKLTRSHQGNPSPVP